MEYRVPTFEWMIAKYNDPEWQPDSEVILEYANLCPLTHGTIVYAIRNFYNAITERINDFENNCEPPAARGTNKPAFIRLKQPKEKPVEAEKEKSSLLLYPNPAINIVNIISHDIQQVIIYDVTGRIVLNRQLNGVDNTQLNIGGIRKGMFFVKVTDKKGHIQTQKLMIQ